MHLTPCSQISPVSPVSESGYFFDETLSIPTSTAPNSLLCPPNFFPPSPTSSSGSVGSVPSSPNLSDSEDFKFSMDEVNEVKSLLKMFPPPVSAAEFTDGHIKRPSNNFILFRKIAHDQKNMTPALSHYNERQFSKIIGKIWKVLSEEEVSTYKKLGGDIAAIHQDMYPIYKYQPKRDKAAWKNFVPQTPPSVPSEDIQFSMDEANEVKSLLKMFPPPISAAEFIKKNSFTASDGHIKRPSNNFILFRKIAHDQKNMTPALSHYNDRQFSKIIGKIWIVLSEEEASTYKKLGGDIAAIHQDMYPIYKYQPKRDKAAWKNFVPSPKRKIKTKHANKQQKQQEQLEPLPDVSHRINTSDLPEINISMPPSK